MLLYLSLYREQFLYLLFSLCLFFSSYLLVCIRVVLLHWASTGICSCAYVFVILHWASTGICLCAYVLLYCTGPLRELLVSVRVVILHWASTCICSCAYVYLHCSWPRAARGIVFRGLDWQQDGNYCLLTKNAERTNERTNERFFKFIFY